MANDFVAGDRVHHPGTGDNGIVTKDSHNTLNTPGTDMKLVSVAWDNGNIIPAPNTTLQHRDA